MKTGRQTPYNICRRLISMAQISEGMRILEPSAGEGTMIDVLLRNYSFVDLQIDCVELNKEFYDVLVDKKYNAIHSDFLDYPITNKYDRIIACPPFKKNIDVVHIMKMYEHLNKYGKIITLTSPFWLTNNEPIQVEFRNWISSKMHEIISLPDHTFFENGKSIPTSILKIYNQ